MPSGWILATLLRNGGRCRRFCGSAFRRRCIWRWRGCCWPLGVGVPLGIISAVKRDTLLDRVCKAFAIFGMAAPQFWIAIMLIILLAGYWGWLPAYGRGETQGWLPEWTQIPNMLRHLVLPASVLALAIIARHNAPGAFCDAGSAGQ